MRTIYCEKFGRLVAAVDDLRVESRRVSPGHVLHVLNCYAHTPENAKADIIQIGVKTGGNDVIIRCRATLAAKHGLSALNGFLVGEGDFVFASFADADAGHTIELHINGILMTLDDWRKAVK